VLAGHTKQPKPSAKLSCMELGLISRRLLAHVHSMHSGTGTHAPTSWQFLAPRVVTAGTAHNHPRVDTDYSCL
jgi:hypothetical protein